MRYRPAPARAFHAETPPAHQGSYVVNPPGEDAVHTPAEPLRLEGGGRAWLGASRPSRGGRPKAGSGGHMSEPAQAGEFMAAPAFGCSDEGTGAHAPATAVRATQPSPPRARASSAPLKGQFAATSSHTPVATSPSRAPDEPSRIRCRYAPPPRSHRSAHRSWAGPQQCSAAGSQGA